MVGRTPQHVVSKLACLVQSSARSCCSRSCPGRLSTAWLVSLVASSCHGLQVATRVVHRSSLRRLICPAQDHFIFLTLLISMTFVFSLNQTLVFLSLYLMLTEHRVTWGKAPPFGDDLNLTYLFASTSEKSYMYVTTEMLCKF